jgi:hypothetical protein
MITLLSADCPTKYFILGCIAAFDIAFNSGSLICLTTTGSPNSQTNIFLSSLVLTNFRFPSIKVIVLTAPRCSS